LTAVASVGLALKTKHEEKEEKDIQQKTLEIDEPRLQQLREHHGSHPLVSQTQEEIEDMMRGLSEEEDEGQDGSGGSTDDSTVDSMPTVPEGFRDGDLLPDGFNGGTTTVPTGDQGAAAGDTDATTETGTDADTTDQP